MSGGEFSVYQFYRNESWERVASFVDARAAVHLAKTLTEGVGARLGMIRRVIITTGGDETAFEWQHGKGVTFPPRKP